MARGFPRRSAERSGMEGGADSGRPSRPLRLSRFDKAQAQIQLPGRGVVRFVGKCERARRRYRQRQARLIPRANDRSGNDGPVSATESGTLPGTAERKLPNAAFSSGAWILRRSIFGGVKRLSVRIRPSGCRNPRAVGARGFLLAWSPCRPSRPDTQKFRAVWLRRSRCYRDRYSL